MLAATLYKDGRMVDTSVKKVALSGNRMDLSVTFDVPEDDLTDYEARLMLLDGSTSAPMVESSTSDKKS